MIQQLTISIIFLFSACSGAALSALLQLGAPPQRYDEARQAYSNRDYATAIAKFQEFLQEPTVTPYSVRARYYLGRSYYLAERYPEAIATYQQLKDGEITGLLARYELCKTYLAAKEQANAEEQYRWLKEEALLATHAQFDRNDPFGPPVGHLPQAQALESWQKYYRNLASELTGVLAGRFRTEDTANSAPNPPAPAVANPATGAASPTPAKQNEVAEMGRNGATRPTIMYKEKARYTEIARLNLVQGVVVLNVIFSADGEIKNIRVVRGLDDGLTEKAIEAARKIRFNPATKDGLPVSVRGNLEFSFNLY